MMTTKYFLAASVLVGTLVGAPVFAQDGPPRAGQERPGGEGGPRPMRATPLQIALDTNKDGELSAEEIATAATTLRMLDKNKDGKLSADELRPVPPPVGPTVAEMVARVMEFDANGDGKLSEDELPEQIQTVFADADTNKDKVLTEAELTPFVEKQDAEAKARAEAQAARQAASGGKRPAGRPMTITPLQAALDANGDGEISAAELANAATALRSLDKNGDGKISAEEMRPAMPMRPEGGPGGPGKPRGEGHGGQEHHG